MRVGGVDARLERAQRAVAGGLRLPQAHELVHEQIFVAFQGVDCVGEAAERAEFERARRGRERARARVAPGGGGAATAATAATSRGRFAAVDAGQLGPAAAGKQVVRKLPPVWVGFAETVRVELAHKGREIVVLELGGEQVPRKLGGAPDNEAVKRGRASAAAG